MPQDRYIQTPDGVYHHFPAEATDAQISEALSTSAKPEPSLAQKAIAMANVAGATMQGAPTVQKELSMLPAAGGAVGGAIGGVGGTVGGLGVGGVPGAVGGAALGGATGEAARQLISRSLGMPAPTSAGEAGKGLATQGAIQGGAELAGAGVGAVMKAAAPALMKSAVKMSPAMAKEFRTDAPTVAQTLLDEGIDVTKGGLAKLQKLFGETNDQIAQAVAGNTTPIAKKSIAAYTLPTAAKLAKDANPQKALEDVGKSVTNFMDHPMYTGDTMLPAEVQAMKKQTYQGIGDAFGEESSATTEAKKALARGGKEELAAAIPEISGLNARDSKIMGAMAGVGQRVSVEGNKNPIGFALVGHQNPKALIAGLIDRSAAVKSMLARGLWEAAGAATGIPPQIIRAAMASIASEGTGGK